MQKMTDYQELYPLPAAAKILGIGMSLMLRLVAQGEIPTTKIGKRRKVTRLTLQKIIEKGQESDNKDGE